MNINVIEMRERLLERHQKELAALDQVEQLAAGLGPVDVSAYPLGSPQRPASTPGRLLAQLVRGPVMPAPTTKKGKRKYKKRVAKTRDVAVPTVTRAEAPVDNSKLKLSEAIRTLGREMGKGTTFTRASLSGQIEKRWPHLAEKLPAIVVSLIDMVSRGELSRRGAGRETVFTVVKMKEKGPRALAMSPSEKEKAWAEVRGDIKVPRDGEEGDEPS